MSTSSVCQILSVVRFDSFKEICILGKLLNNSYKKDY
jgi:hypothetical protein